MLSVDEVADMYKTEVNQQKPESSIGLRAGVASDLLQKYGPNVLKPPKKKHWTLVFMECLCDLFNIMLLIAGFVTYVLFIMDPVNNFQNVCIILKDFRHRLPFCCHDVPFAMTNSNYDFIFELFFFFQCYIGAILIVIAFLNAYIVFYQGRKSAAILESFMAC